MQVTMEDVTREVGTLYLEKQMLLRRIEQLEQDIANLIAVNLETQVKKPEEEER